MSQPSDVREAAADALDLVKGLRAHPTPPGAIVPPAALIDFESIGPFPADLGTAADYVLRITLLVQLGDFRNAQTRIETLFDPVGASSSSAVAAIQSDDRFGQVRVDSFGDITYGGQQYAGAVLLVDAYF